MKAIWNDAVIAESSTTVQVDGNHYFPMDSLNKELVKESATTSVCGWKGTANYFSLVVQGEENTDAVWYYQDPLDAAKEIKNHVAFWKGVQVVES